MIARIGAQEGLSDAQIRAMQATARVESGLNPSAVGDNGTSFGLFQHHIGGAGGSSLASAQRYLDPATSIRERAREFRRLNIRGGRGAASLQRPADPSGYAKKVDAVLSGQQSELNAPVQSSMGNAYAGASQPPSQSAPSLTWGQNFLKQSLYADDPVAQSLFDGFYGSQATPPSSQDPQSTTYDTGQVGPSHSGKLGNYQDIVALGKQWGLNIQGDFQTTGGSHANGSKHYQKKAVDFGDATNDPARMRQFAAYLSRNAGTLGISDVYYDPQNWYISNGKKIKGKFGGHSDHLHVDVR